MIFTTYFQKSFLTTYLRHDIEFKFQVSASNSLSVRQTISLNKRFLYCIDKEVHLWIKQFTEIIPIIILAMVFKSRGMLLQASKFSIKHIKSNLWSPHDSYLCSGSVFNKGSTNCLNCTYLQILLLKLWIIELFDELFSILITEYRPECK